MNFKFGVRMKYDDPHRTLTFDLWRHHVRDDVKGQDYNDSSSVWCTSAHNSTTKHRRSTKNGRKVVRPTCDIPRQLRGQKSKVKVTRPLNAVTENQSYLQNGLRTTNLVYFWSMITCITNVHGDLQAEALAGSYKSPLAGGGGILWQWSTTDTQLVTSAKQVYFLQCFDTVGVLVEFWMIGRASGL